MTQSTGTLYIVATPIGNRADITTRALEILGAVDLIAAEDTRHSLPLLQHYGIDTRVVAYHEHNEDRMSPRLLARLEAGEDLALISDAGTPLMSDPGYTLVRQAAEHGIRVVPIPGASALVAALSAAGLPTDRFVFEGFPPGRPQARRTRLQALSDEARTLVFYESSHRIEAAIADMAEVFGPGRRAAVARELTKRFEEIERGTLAHLQGWLSAEPTRRKGEFVVLVEGAPEITTSLETEGRRVLQILLGYLSIKQAAAAAAEITGLRRNALYQLALELEKGG